MTDLLVNIDKALVEGKTADVREWRELLGFVGEEQECADDVLSRLLDKLSDDVRATKNEEFLRRFQQLLQYSLVIERKFPNVVLPGSNSSTVRPYTRSAAESNLLLYCPLDANSDGEAFGAVLERSFSWQDEAGVRITDPEVIGRACTSTMSGISAPVSETDLYEVKSRRRFTALPSYLLVALKRSHWMDDRLLRIGTKCAPLMNLALDKLVSSSTRTSLTATKSSKHLYELCAAVAHLSGSLSATRGHFVCYRKNENGQWCDSLLTRCVDAVTLCAGRSSMTRAKCRFQQTTSCKRSPAVQEARLQRVSCSADDLAFDNHL